MLSLIRRWLAPQASVNGTTDAGFWRSVGYGGRSAAGV